MTRAGIRPDRDKAVSNAIHARTRAAERLGLHLSCDDMDAIAGLAATASADSMPLYRDPKFARREWVAVRWAGEWRGLVLDRATRSVVTFLPPHAIDRWRRSLPAAP
jgi:hypothetical protein